MKTKVLIPVMTMILAVGMSFASVVNPPSDPTTDYIRDNNGNFKSLHMELDCGNGNSTCQVQIVKNGPIYDVYDAQDPQTLKTGDGTVKKLWQQ